MAHFLCTGRVTVQTYSCSLTMDDQPRQTTTTFWLYSISVAVSFPSEIARRHTRKAFLCRMVWWGNSEYQINAQCSECRRGMGPLLRPFLTTYRKNYEDGVFWRARLPRDRRFHYHVLDNWQRYLKNSTVNCNLFVPRDCFFLKKTEILPENNNERQKKKFTGVIQKNYAKCCISTNT